MNRLTPPSIRLIQSRNNGKGQYRLTIPATLSRTGEREQIHFPPTPEGLEKAECELERIVAEFKEGGHAGPELSLEERQDAEKALEILAPFGVTLCKAANFYADRFATSKTLQALRDEYLASRINRRGHRHKGEVTLILRKLLDELSAGRLVTDVDRKDALAALGKMEARPSRWNRALSVSRSFFAYGIEQGIIKINPLEGVKMNEFDHAEIRVLTVDETRRLLAECKGWVAHYAALTLFSGIRPLEAQRLQWKSINLELRHIDLRLTGRKRGSRKIIPISDNLASWLTPAGEGLVVPVSQREFKETWKAARARAGIEWQEDIARHSFCSYHLAFHGDMAKTQLEARHRDGTMLERHYLHGVTKEDAAKYWGLVPG